MIDSTKPFIEIAGATIQLCLRIERLRRPLRPTLGHQVLVVQLISQVHGGRGVSSIRLLSTLVLLRQLLKYDLRRRYGARRCCVSPVATQVGIDV
jgi:hypothetical protein